MVSGLPLTWLPILIKLVASQDFNKPDLPQCGDLNMQSDDALAKLIGSLKEDSLECFKAGVVQSEARHLIYQDDFGRTPIHLIVMHSLNQNDSNYLLGSQQVMKRHKDLEVPYVRDYHGNTPLHLCAYHNCGKKAILGLIDNEIDRMQLVAKNDLGYSPSDVALCDAKVRNEETYAKLLTLPYKDEVLWTSRYQWYCKKPVYDSAFCLNFDLNICYDDNHVNC